VLNWPLEAIHMIALKNGKVLCLDLSDVRVWNPVTNTFSDNISRPIVPGFDPPRPGLRGRATLAPCPPLPMR